MEDVIQHIVYKIQNMKQTVKITTDDGLKALMSIWEIVMLITDMQWTWEQIYMDEAKDKETGEKVTKLKFPCKVRPSEYELQSIGKLDHVKTVEFRDRPKTGNDWCIISSGIELFLDGKIHDS